MAHVDPTTPESSFALHSSAPSPPSSPEAILGSPPESPRGNGRRVLLNTGAMAGSSLWRILISFVLQVFVTRQLGFEALGQYTVALAYLNVSQIVAELGLQGLLVRELAQDSDRRRSYFTFALWLQLGASLLVWLGLWGLIALLPYSTVMTSLLWMVGATLPFYAVTIACQTLFQGCERMELVMLVEMVINTLIGFLSLVALYWGGSVVQLVLILIITQSLSAIYCLYLVWHHRLLSNQNSAGEVANPMILLRQAMPFYGLSLADVLLQRLDILLLSALGGDLLTGIYSAAYNVVRVLLKLIQSYWKALYPTLSRLLQQSASRYRQLCEMSLHYGLILVFLAASIGIGAADNLLSLVYGNPSVESISAFKILVWVAPIFLVELYAMTMLMVENRTGYSLLIMLIHLAAIALLLPLLTPFYQAVGAAWAVLLASLVGTAASVVSLRRFGMPESMPRTYRILLPAAAATLVMHYLPGGWIRQMSSGIGIYLVLLPLCGIVTHRNLNTLRTTLLNR